jgi:uncharacterized SAM-binding protein YcdF (DUF218 family)
MTMTILLIIIFFAVATISSFSKFKTVGATLHITALALLILIGCGIVPHFLSSWLESPFFNHPEISWKNKNAIIMLGNGTMRLPKSARVEPIIPAYSRICAAAKLYKSCKNHTEHCTIILSGGDALATGRSEAEVYREVLIDLGIKTADIILEANSLNTYQNTEFVSRILKAKPFDNVVLTTSGIHLKRSLLYFSYFGIYPTPFSADYSFIKFSIVPLATNFFFTDCALHEYAGILRFFIYNYFGWNTKTP